MEDAEDTIESVETTQIAGQEPTALEDGRISFDVILQVKPQKMDQITYQFIDGKKCIIIPMEEDEHANVNGHTDLV